jgi:hypothetical protein
LAFNSTPPKPSANASPAPAETETSPAATETETSPAATETEADIYDSLLLLAWPPPSLGMRFLSKGPHGRPKASLTRGEVIDLADAAARSRGYDPSEYQIPKPQYDPSDQAWSLLYEKAADETGKSEKFFSIAVGDQTKRIALVPGN